MKMKTHASRAPWLLAALLLPLAFGACHPLDVSNPAIIQENQLGDTTMVPVMATGVDALFQRAFGTMAFYGAFFSDELQLGHVYQPYQPFYERKPDGNNDFVAATYNAVHALRGASDTLGVRMVKLLNADSASSIDLAKVRAMGGYAFVMLGEDFCGSPINAGPLLTPKELFDSAQSRFDDAIAIASASSASNADEIKNLALVGGARAALDAGEDARALGYAQQVPPDFQYWARYSDNSAAQYNPFWQTTQSYDPNPIATEERWAGIDSLHTAIDPRIPMSDTTEVLMDGRYFRIPYQPYMFSGWQSGAQVPFTKNMGILAASGLEAQYIMQEINGPTLDFLNARRAVGGEPALTSLPPDPQAELRVQRARDFFMTGHHLGDLRRYIAEFNDNEFVTGDVPQETGQTYAPADSAHECIPLSQAEITDNPNLH